MVGPEGRHIEVSDCSSSTYCLYIDQDHSTKRLEPHHECPLNHQERSKCRQVLAEALQRIVLSVELLIRAEVQSET